MQAAEQLKIKLSSFNPSEPYIWKMKLNKDDYEQIYKDISHRSLNLTAPADALLALVYIAEWYKREYTNRNKDTYKKAFGDTKPDLKQIWETLGIDDKYLYEGESGKLRLFSTFILGGLSVKHELQKNEEPFLKTLCRLYNKQDVSFESIVKDNKSIAFNKSIENGHCLHEYFHSILSDNDDLLPFDKADLADTTTKMCELVEQIRTINDQVNKSKFRLEWIFVKTEDVFVRSVRFWLNPEEQGKKHQLLRGARLVRWGIRNPDELSYLYIGLRYKKGKDVVEDTDIEHSVFSYRNTGNPDVGFIAEVEHYKHILRVPVCDFDNVEVVTWDEKGNAIVVQEEKVDFSARQLYREENGEDLWTTRTLSQKDTVLLFNEEWCLTESSIDKNVEQLPIYNKRYGEGIMQFWCEIHTSVTITNAEGEQKTFFNRIGHDYVSTHAYDNVIKYAEENKVAVHEFDKVDEIDFVDFMPLIFSKSDIICYHCQKDDNDEDMFEEIAPESLEYKTKAGFERWEDDSPVPYGKIRVRATIKERTQNLDVFYAPGPISRDCKNNTIRYKSFVDETEQVIDERETIGQSIANKELLQPTTKLRLGNDYIFAEVEVYRPTNVKEVCYCDKLLKHDEDGKVVLPYVIKNYITINDFSEAGFKQYELRKFRSIYPDINNSDYRYSGMYTNAIDGKKFTDEKFPDYIQVFVRNEYSADMAIRYCYWDCAKDTKPMKVPEVKDFDLPPGFVMFQDQRRRIETASCQCIEKEDKKSNPFARAKSQAQTKEVSILEVFKVAVEYNQYFFHFKPLRSFAQLLEKDIKPFYQEIYGKLKTEARGYLTDRNKEALLRFADEFSLDTLKDKLIREFIEK